MVRIGPYEIDGEIARGGMGIVYRGRGPRGPVAIKVVLDPDPELRARVRQELAALRRLDHPAIVAFHELVQDAQNRDALVMELVDGESLQQRLKRAGPLPVEEAVALTRQLCDAVAHAHDRHVLHRDLKPDNVLVTPQGQVKLTDFGLGKVTDLSQTYAQQGLTRTGELLGTPAYMPPEQAAGERHRMGPAADVYGLGATLFALLTGMAPFRGPTLLNTLHAVLDDPAPPPSSLRPDVPPWLDDVVLRCLAKDPADRYLDAQTLGAALDSGAVRPRSRALGWVTGLLGLGLAVGLGAASAWPQATRTVPQAGSPPDAPAKQAPPLSSEDEDALQRALQQGREHYAAEDFLAAREALDEAVRLAPSAPRAYALRGSVLIQLGEVQAGIDDFSRALLEGHPDPFNLHLNRAEAYLFCGEYRQGLDDSEEALRLQGDSPAALRARGRALLFLHEPARAITDLDQVIRERERPLPPEKLAWCFLHRGMAHEALGRPHEALADYDAAHALRPTSADALFYRGLLRINMGDLADGKDDLDLALTLSLEFDQRGKALFQRAFARLRLRDFQGALDDSDAALQARPELEDKTEFHLLRGDALFALREFDPARAAFTRALQLDPNSARALYQRSQCGVALGQLWAALDDVEDALSRDPTSRKTRQQRLELLTELGRWWTAIQAADELLNATPDDPELLGQRGLLRWLVGEREGARVDLERAGTRNAPNWLIWAAAAASDWTALTPFAERDDWSGALSSHLLGRLTAEDLIQRAQASGDPLQLGQAHGYAGLKLEVAGDLEAAKPSYRACLALGRLRLTVQRWARLRLLPAVPAHAALARGMRLLAGGQEAPALEAFDAALAAWPDFPRAHMGRGVALVRLLRRDEALAAYDAALRLDPRLAKAYYNRACAHAADTRWPAALADFDACLRLAPDDAEAWTQRAAVHLELKEAQRALEDASEALRLDPTSANALTFRGVARRRLADFEGAALDFDRALELEPDHAAALWNRARLRRER